MSEFEKLGVDNVTPLRLESPILNIDLDATNDWDSSGFSTGVILDSNLDVAVTLTGFWGAGSEIQITASYIGASKIGTVTFKSTAADEDEAVAELNTAIDDLLFDYLPTQGWRILDTESDPPPKYDGF